MAGFDEYTKQMQQISRSIAKVCEPFGGLNEYYEFANRMPPDTKGGTTRAII